MHKRSRILLVTKIEYIAEKHWKIVNNDIQFFFSEVVITTFKY